MDTSYDRHLEAKMVSFVASKDGPIRMSRFFEEFSPESEIEVAKVLAFGSELESYLTLDHPELGQQEYPSILDIPLDKTEEPVTAIHVTGLWIRLTQKEQK